MATATKDVDREPSRSNLINSYVSILFSLSLPFTWFVLDSARAIWLDVNANNRVPTNYMKKKISRMTAQILLRTYNDNN